MKKPSHLRARLFDLAYAARPLWKRSAWFLHELRYEGYEATALEVESELTYLLGNHKAFRLTVAGIDALEREDLS